MLVGKIFYFNMRSESFIDLFSGCGGLSLGLSMAGLRGIFAVERDPMAFSTFADNFLSDRKLPISNFEWPNWLEKKAWAIDDLLGQHELNLKLLNNKVDVLTGGPPCQGFSFSGKRDGNDPRNQLFKRYVRMVALVRPKLIVLENVPGMRVAHVEKNGASGAKHRGRESYFEKLKSELELQGYDVRGEILDAVNFGVPQKRSRLIVIGVRSDLSLLLPEGVDTVFKQIELARKDQIKKLKLLIPITSSDAISDLRSDLTYLKPCEDPSSKSGFFEAAYHGPDTQYQRLMRSGVRSFQTDSMRMVKHTDVVASRFEKIIKECKQGGNMNGANREKFGLHKHRISLMAANAPAPTITTLPDDILHYVEGRILTVRECARIQSFPDWFHFKGKFTTGGKQRKNECPRYTQVGNAVPPLLARAIGVALSAVLNECSIYAVTRPLRLAPVSQKV